MWSQLSTNAQKVSLFGATLRATVDGNTFQGTLHYCDDQFLLLKNDDEFYFLNQQQLTEVQPLDVADPQVTLQNLLNVDLGKLTEEIIRQEIKEPQQLLFEHISKLYGETEWQGQDIVIRTLGIRIVAPYTSSNAICLGFRYNCGGEQESSRETEEDCNDHLIIGREVPQVLVNILLMSHQISLLDYVLNEQEIKYIKRRNLTIETVHNASPKYSANSKLSNSSIDEFVSMRMFRALIAQIEDRLNDLDLRVENKEKLQHLNESLTCLRHCNHNPTNKQKQDLERTQQSVDDSESRVAVAPKRQQSLAQLTTSSNKKQDINETGLLNRLNLFEKKLLQLDEKLSKFIKEGELFRKDVESKIEVTYILKQQSKLKGNQWSLDKFSDQTKDLLNKINDIGGNHKEMTQHILKVKDDLSYYQSSCLHFNEQNMGQLNKVDSAVTILNNVVCKINDELSLYTPAVDQIGMDLLVIMKMYKDMLQIIYKK